MAIGLIIIGDEILSGKRTDQHFPKVVSMLKQRGLQLSWAEYVGDEPARLVALLKRSFASGDIVFSFGGIGATPDDHTRQAAADALGLRCCCIRKASSISSSASRKWEPRRACRRT